MLTAINGLGQDYNNINAPAFAGAVSGVPTAASLKGAQDAHTGAILGNVKGPAAGTTISSDAPPALAASRASLMKNATDFIQNQGAATGKLGGYGDSWFNSGLNEQDAARKIGVGNLFANETKSLIGPEQDLAAAAAYKTPSPLSSALQGLGSMLGSTQAGAATARAVPALSRNTIRPAGMATPAASIGDKPAPQLQLRLASSRPTGRQQVALSASRHHIRSASLT